MRLELHPLAEADISRIIDHYEVAGGAELADEFYSELRVFLKKAAQTSRRVRSPGARYSPSEPRKISFPFSLSNCQRSRANIGGAPQSQETVTGNPAALKQNGERDLRPPLRAFQTNACEPGPSSRSGCRDYYQFSFNPN